MNSVEFDEDRNTKMFYNTISKKDPRPKMMEFLVNHHMARDLNQARYILIGVAILIFLISLYFFRSALITPEIISA